MPPSQSSYKLKNTYGPEHDLMVLIAYAQKLHINIHADILSVARGLNLS